MTLRISAKPFSIPAQVSAQVWQMGDLELIQCATHAAIAFVRTGELSNLESAVLEEFARRFDRMKREGK